MTEYRRNLLKEINIHFKEEKLESFHWDHLSFNKSLSEEFIREFKDKVEWYHISNDQILSDLL